MNELISALIDVLGPRNVVIDEPGNFAFFYPNGDLGLGSSRPADAMASAPLHDGGNMARLRSATMSHPLPVRRGPSTKAY